MIEDERALECGYLPEELHHREGQIAALSADLDAITRGHSGEDVIITGPTGTGKTTLAKFVVDELEAEAFGVRSGYVNCMNEPTRAGVIYTIVDDAGLSTHLQKTGFSHSDFIDCIRDSDEQLVAIIDEVDYLEDATLLHQLYGLQNVTMLLIAESYDLLLAGLDSRVRGRLRTADHIPLTRYSHTELCDILWSRIDVGLAPGVVDADAVDRIADIAAGDARLAIAQLRRAVKHVEKLSDRGKVTVEDVEEITEDAKAEVQSIEAEYLGTHLRLLYDIIREEDRISASDLHDRYEAEAPNPKSQRTRRRYLERLERYGLIIASGEGRGREYWIRSTTN